MGEGEKIPTLESVIQLVNKQLFINIEVKAPYSKEIKDKYNYRKTIEMVHELVASYSLKDHCLISSFDSDVLSTLAEVNE